MELSSLHPLAVRSLCWTAPLIILLSISPLTTCSGGQRGIERVRATDESILFEIASTDVGEPDCAIEAFALSAPEQVTATVWSGTVDSEEIRIPRNVDGRDRLYLRFQFVRGSEPVGPALNVTDLSEISREAAALPQPTTKKGLQGIVDLDEAIALGVKHTAVNVSFNNLYDESGESPLVHHVGNQEVSINAGYVARLDQTIRRMTEAGMRVYLILLNRLPPPDASTALVDPRTVRTRQAIGGFHIDTKKSLRLYRGLIEFLAKRYSRPDAAHGTVAGYIVGNEIQSHYAWYNLGEITLAELVSNYARVLRVADLAVRRYHPDARVFVSMDHNWTRRQTKNPKSSVPGRRLLTALVEHITAHGDFPWGVAFHPYPENLGDPRTWKDTTAVLSFDTPRITFKNLGLLVAFLRQPKFLYEGRLRPIILSEQGFHCLAAPRGELLQAAAFVYAYERVRRMKGIDAFIYHRHVDHAGEGGLRLGLRANRPGTVNQPGKARKIFEIFRKIDTPEHAKASKFALDVIGLDSWNELAPQPVVKP